MELSGNLPANALDCFGIYFFTFIRIVLIVRNYGGKDAEVLSRLLTKGVEVNLRAIDQITKRAEI